MKTVTVPYRKPGIFVETIGRIRGGKIPGIIFSGNLFILIPSAFLLGRSDIAGGLMPFGFAFFAASASLTVNRLLIAVSIILGMLTHASLDRIYVTAASMLLFNVFCLPFRNSKSRMTFKYACLAFLSILIPQTILVSLQGFLLYDLLRALFCSFIVFVLYFVYKNSVSLLAGTGKKSVFTSEEIISIAITAAFVLSGFGEMQLLGFSLRNVLCIIMILMFSNKCGAGVGAAAGVAIGLIVGMSTKMTPVSIGTYAFCGLLSGIFSGLGKVGSGLGFVMGNAILTIYLNGSAETLVYLKEIILAVGVFFIIPQKLIDSAAYPFNRDFSSNEGKRGYSRRIKDITVEKLIKFSKAFSELAKTFNEVSQTKVVTDKQDISVLFDRVADRICRDCSLCLHCWDRNFYNTYQVMFKIVEDLEVKGRIDENDIPAYFLDRCERINDFIGAVNNMYELFKVDMVWKSRMGESRGLISQQFDGLSNIISGLADDINTEVDFINILEDDIFNELKNSGINVKEVAAYKNRWGKYEAIILHGGCGGARTCISRIEKIVTQSVGRRMTRENEECCKARDGSCTLKLVEEEDYKITNSVAKLPKHDSSVSGDSFTFLNNGKGEFVLALSDGMGSGYKAAVQSKAAVTLLESFLESGFDKDTAVRLINSVLFLESNDESFSTIDISVINLFNGEVEFVKIGAAPTYIKKAERVEIVKSASLPAGILDSINVELAHKSVESGDMIIMVTDGIVDGFANEEPGDRVLLKFIQEVKSINPQHVADSILEKACTNSGGEPNDDMTVLVAKIWKKSR